MRSICVLSGGMDSTTLLYHLLNLGDEVEAVSFDYGQRHKKELSFASRVCERLGIPHQIVDISNIVGLLGGSALTSSEVEVPEGHYEDESMKATVVPNRNMIMLAIATGYAVFKKFDRIATAVHAGDHAIYPDCRPKFIGCMRSIMSVANHEVVDLYAPYLFKTKTEICVEGLSFGIDYENDTWSCYKGGEEHCGVCGTCVERDEALRGARNA